MILTIALGVATGALAGGGRPVRGSQPAGLGRGHRVRGAAAGTGGGAVSTQTDRHANARDRKREKRRTGDVMRGKRSVFEVQKAIVKRSRKATG